MATSMADITATLTLDDAQFQSGMSAAGSSIDSLSGKASASDANIRAAGAGMAAFGAAGVAAFGSSVQAASEFQQELDVIGSVGGADAQASMDQIQAAALQMGAQTKFSAQEAAQGMEELIK